MKGDGLKQSNDCWPAPPSIHRGLEWPLCLNRLFLDCLSVSKFSNFFLFHPPLFIQDSTEECSTVQLLARSLEYLQRIRVVSVFELLDCLLDCSLIICVSANFLIFLLLTSSFTVLSPLLLARSPEYPQRIRVASVFEPSDCLLDCSLFACVSANFLIFLLLTSSLYYCLLCYFY